MSLTNKEVVNITIIVTILTVIGKFMGLMREWALAYAYGTTYVTDSYVMAQSVANLLVTVVILGFLTGMMPVYQKTKLEDDPTAINRFMDNLYSVSFVAILAVVGLTVLLSDPLMYLLAPKFDATSHDLSVQLSRIIVISVIFNLINNIQTQQLKAENKFIPTTFVSFVLNGVLISALLFIAPVFGIQGVAWGNVVAAFLICLMLQIFVRKLGYRFHPRFDLKDEKLRHVGRLGIPIIIGNSVATVNTIVDRMLASGLPSGSVAALNFSYKLSAFVTTIISMGVGAVCYTKLAQLAAKEDFEEFKSFLRKVINALIVIVIPATAGLIVLASPSVELVFEYGAFDASSREMTSYALMFYSIGLIGAIIREIVTYGLFSIHETKAPLINAAISVAINIVLNIILVQVMGIGGLALATSISFIVAALLMLYSLRKRIGPLGLKDVLITFVKVLAVSAVMAVAVALIYPVLKAVLIRNSLSLILTIICGVLIYSVLIYFMRIKEVGSLVRLAINKIKR